MTPNTATDLTDAPKIQPPSTAGMTTKVVKGSLWTLAGQIAPMAFSLIATPFVIRMLGSEAYGVLILVGLIPSYFTFADLGMTYASTKFAADAYSEGDLEEEARTIRTAALITLLSASAVMMIVALFSYPFARFFSVPDHLLSEASLALKFTSVAFVATALGGILNTPQVVRLRMDLNTLIGFVPRTLGIIATPFVIYFGGGVSGAAAVLMIASILSLAGHIYFSNKLLPTFSGFSISREAFRPLIRFGGALAFSSIASLLLINAEKGILAQTVSVQGLAYYNVAFTLATMMTLFSVAMSQSLIPAFSQLQSESNKEQLNALYSRGIRMVLIVVIPMLVLTSLVAKPFFTRWAGEEFGQSSSVPFYILASGLLINSIAHFPGAAILGAGRSDVYAKLYWIELFPYLLLVWFLASQFGIVGAAMAWSIRVIIDGILHFVLAKRVAGVAVLRREFTSFIVPILIMAFPFIMNLYLQEINAPVGGLTLLCLGVYAVLIYTRVLRPDEILWFGNRLKGLAGLGGSITKL